MASSFNVSVIIPVYNVEKYIKRSIESVLIQDEVCELILVDDGSTDNSLKICQQMQLEDERIVIVHHEGTINKGASASRNAGIKAAKNEFVAFLDSDDYYLPNRFLKTKLCFENDNTVDGVYEMIGLHSSSIEIKHFSTIISVQYDELFENLQPIGEKVWFHIDGITVKKRIFDKCGFFDESLKTSEDTFQWFKMAASCKMVSGNITNSVALSDRSTNGLSSDKIQVHKDFIKMLLKLFQYCKNQNLARSKKELVFNRLFYFLSCSPYDQYFKGVNKFKLVVELIIVDPIYVILKSNYFKSILGYLIRYN